MKLKKLQLYLKLTRFHSSILTAFAPVCTAAALGLQISILHYIGLFFIGILFHIFLFVLNEVRDIDIDKTSDSLKNKPLVDGSIPITNAKILVYSTIILERISKILLYLF